MHFYFNSDYRPFFPCTRCERYVLFRFKRMRQGGKVLKKNWNDRMPIIIFTATNSEKMSQQEKLH